MLLLLVAIVASLLLVATRARGRARLTMRELIEDVRGGFGIVYVIAKVVLLDGSFG